MNAIERRLRRATHEEREVLAKILRAKGSRATEILAALQKQSRSLRERWFGHELTYREILLQIVESEGLTKKANLGASVAALETCIAEAWFERHVAPLPEARRSALLSGDVPGYSLLGRNTGLVAPAVFYFNRIQSRTLGMVAAALENHQPGRCLSLLAECQSIQDLQQIAGDLREYRSELVACRGFRFIFSVAESLTSGLGERKDLAEAVGAIRSTGTPEEVAETAARTVALFDRWQPERVAAVLESFENAVTDTVAACYAAAHEDSEMHYASTMLLASQVASYLTGEKTVQ